MRLFTTLLGLALVSGVAVAQEMEMRLVLMGPIGTKISHKGDKIFARVAQPDIFKDDMVQGTVTEVRSGGKLRGGSVLNFSFESVQHAGQAVPISTEIRGFHNSKGQAEVDEEGRVIRRGGGNAGKAVAATGAGGLIGGIAGGLKGAAIGAGVGAAASIAVIEIACDEPEIRFDAGSTITVSAKSRSGQPLTSLGRAPASGQPAPVYASAAPAAAAPPAAAYAAAPVSAAPASGSVNPAGGGAQPDFTVLKDDFVPGEKVLLFDDFTDMSPDEAPPHWKVRGSSPTLMAAGGVRQLSIGYRTNLTPSVQDIPKNFTVETEYMVDPKASGDIKWEFYATKEGGDPALHIFVGPDGDNRVRAIVGSTKEGLLDADSPWNPSRPTKQAIWVQNGRVRVYLDGLKIMDANQVELPNLDRAVLVCNFFGDQKKVNLRSVRIAESTPDFSRSILSSGRYVTHAILFDTNSDHIRPESAPIIKSIGFGLQTTPDLKLKIEGHTDSSGTDDFNRDLSRRRAEAVKQVLVAQFQIDGSRLTTDGLGASKPIDSNDTTQGRAQNRRVEFVKQ